MAQKCACTHCPKIITKTAISAWSARDRAHEGAGCPRPRRYCDTCAMMRCREAGRGHGAKVVR